MTYSVDYFIGNFEQIPLDKWFKGGLIDKKDNSKRCAIGHCCEFIDGYHRIMPEGYGLLKLFSNELGANVAIINDGYDQNFRGANPKERILSALYEIKARRAIKEAQSIADTQIPQLKTPVAENVPREKLTTV